MQPLLEKIPLAARITIKIFTNDSKLEIRNFDQLNREISLLKSSVDREHLKGIPRDKDVLICGLKDFGDSVIDGLRDAGFFLSQIHSEGFY